MAYAWVEVYPLADRSLSEDQIFIVSSDKDTLKDQFFIKELHTGRVSILRPILIEGAGWYSEYPEMKDSRHLYTLTADFKLNPYYSYELYNRERSFLRKYKSQIKPLSSREAVQVSRLKEQQIAYLPGLWQWHHWFHLNERIMKDIVLWHNKFQDKFALSLLDPRGIKIKRNVHNEDIQKAGLYFLEDLENSRRRIVNRTNLNVFFINDIDKIYLWGVKESDRNLALTGDYYIYSSKGVLLKKFAQVSGELQIERLENEKEIFVFFESGGEFAFKKIEFAAAEGPLVGRLILHQFFLRPDDQMSGELVLTPVIREQTPDFMPFLEIKNEIALLKFKIPLDRVSSTNYRFSWKVPKGAPLGSWQISLGPLKWNLFIGMSNPKADIRNSWLVHLPSPNCKKKCDYEIWEGVRENVAHWQNGFRVENKIDLLRKRLLSKWLPEMLWTPKKNANTLFLKNGDSIRVLEEAQYDSKGLPPYPDYLPSLEFSDEVVKVSKREWSHMSYIDFKKNQILYGAPLEYRLTHLSGEAFLVDSPARLERLLDFLPSSFKQTDSYRQWGKCHLADSLRLEDLNDLVVLCSLRGELFEQNVLRGFLKDSLIKENLTMVQKITILNTLMWIGVLDMNSIEELKEVPFKDLEDKSQLQLLELFRAAFEFEDATRVSENLKPQMDPQKISPSLYLRWHFNISKIPNVHNILNQLSFALKMEDYLWFAYWGAQYSSQKGNMKVTDAHAQVSLDGDRSHHFKIPAGDRVHFESNNSIGVLFLYSKTFLQ